MERLVISIGICSIAMSVISFLFIGLSYILRETWSAKHRFWLWLFILIGFLTPFKPSFGIPLYEIATNTASATTQETIHDSVPPQFIADNTATAGFSKQINVVTVFLVVWIFGIVVLTVWYAYKHYQFKKYTERFAEPCDTETYTIALAAANGMGIKQLNIITLPGIATPMMTGFRYPTIILPENTYSNAELQLIIKHELTHFKRLDLVSKCLCLICRIVHWFNPFVKIITSHVDQVCELACDEAVMSGEYPENRKLYCQSILSTVMAQSKLKSALQPVIASDFGNSKHELKHRLAMIVCTKSKRSFAAVCVAIAIAVSFSGTVVVVTDATNNSDTSSLIMSDKQPTSEEEESIFTNTTTTTNPAEYDELYTTTTAGPAATSTSGFNAQTTTATWTTITTVTTDAPYVTSAPVTTPTVMNQNHSNTTSNTINTSRPAETTTTTATVYTP